jgi:hypothetical protein
MKLGEASVPSVVWLFTMARDELLVLRIGRLDPDRGRGTIITGSRI